MILDNSLEFSTAQAVTNTGDTASTKSIDGINGGNALNSSLKLLLVCNETATSAGAATLTVRLETSDASNFASATVLTQTAAIPLASLVAGATLMKMVLPFGLKRYTRIVYTVGTAALTAGKFSAFLVSGMYHR